MKNRKKELIAFIFLLAVLVFVYFYRVDITKYIVRKYMIEDNIVTKEPNAYAKKIDYKNLKITTDLIPGNKEELKNLIYTMLDNGWTSLTFYTEDDYTTYLEDIDEMTNNGTFASINNYVHPFNSFKNIDVNVNQYGIITIIIEKNYTDEEIAVVNSKIDNIIRNNITSNMSTKTKIQTFHDYIVNHTVYDKEEAKKAEINQENNVLSYKAYNVLVNGTGLCGGYSDTLAIFLTKIGVNNFKIGTDKHVWNAIYLDNKWQHIDMTWDDPVTSNNTQILSHDYFLISTLKLKQLDKTSHNFDTKLYLEFK